jgi:gas vesicle protein
MILSIIHIIIHFKTIIMKGSTKITLGVLGALAAGVAIGLMIAPEKGSETRKRIKKKAEKWVDQMGEVLSDGKKLMEDVKENSKNLKKAAEEKLGKVKESLG